LPNWAFIVDTNKVRSLHRKRDNDKHPSKRETKMAIAKQIEQARKVVNSLQFGTQEWESAMQIVRDLVAKHDAQKPAQEFCSIDSGFHSTRLLSGRIVKAAN
jgi:hypothetical protein